MNCEKCGQPLDTADSFCGCSPKTHKVPGSGELGFKGFPVAMVVEGPPDSPEGRRVESRPASGGRAFSRTDSTGTFVAELCSPLDRGRQGEGHAIEVLIQALTARGDQAQLLPGSDDRGEDGLLSINGRDIPVQVVSVPIDPSFWKELSTQGTALTEGNVVELVRQALVHKKDKASGTLLVLDAAQIGAIVGPALVKSYHEVYSDPEREFSLKEAWIVGPTIRSTIRLGTMP
jgi:hypothetical protein